MIIIIRALANEERMMETMIPPQVGMRLRTKKEKKEAKEAQKKKKKEAIKKEKMPK